MSEKLSHKPNGFGANSNRQKKEDFGYQPKSSVDLLRSVAHTLPGSF